MGEGVKGKIQNLLTRAHARNISFPTLSTHSEHGEPVPRGSDEEVTLWRCQEHHDGRRASLPPRTPRTDTHRGRAQPLLRHGLDFCLYDEKRCGSKKMTCVDRSALTGIRSNAGRLRGAPH